MLYLGRELSARRWPMLERSADVPGEEEIRQCARESPARTSSAPRRRRRRRHTYRRDCWPRRRSKEEKTRSSQRIAALLQFSSARLSPFCLPRLILFGLTSSFSYRRLPVLPSFSRGTTPAPPSILSRPSPLILRTPPGLVYPPPV